MKKINFGIALSLIGIAMIMGSCKNNLVGTSENSVSKETEIEKHLSKLLPEQYSQIGTNHNQILSDFYFGSSNSRSATTNYKQLSVEDYFGEFDKIYYFDINDNEKNSRNVTNEYFSTDSLLENELISSESAEYISEIENLLNNPLDSLEETQDAISKIEIQVLEDKKDNLYDFFSYAETAKSSLEFWTQNIETLENSNENINSRGVIKNLWNQYKHRIGMMALSDASGAGTGACIGAYLGIQILGTDGAVIGATVGGTVVGAASSAKAFKEDKFCVVVSIKDITDKIKEHK